MRGVSFAALRHPSSVGRRSGSPCFGLPRDGRLFLAGHACVRKRVARWRLVTGSPCHRMFRGDSGLPRLLGRPRRACPGRSPRRAGRLLAPLRQRPCCLRSYGAPSAPGTMYSFGAAVPRPARLRTYASPDRVTTTRRWRTISGPGSSNPILRMAANTCQESLRSDQPAAARPWSL